MTFIAAPAMAQTKNDPVLLGAGVSFAKFTCDGCGTAKGLTLNLNKPVKSSGNMQTGIFGEFDWLTDSGDHGTGFLVGPRFAHTGNSQATPFFEAGFGVTHFSAADCDGDGCSANPFTFEFGGGVDVKLSAKVNFRGQLDFMRFNFSSDQGGGQNAIRFFLGISCPLGSK